MQKAQISASFAQKFFRKSHRVLEELGVGAMPENVSTYPHGLSEYIQVVCLERRSWGFPFIYSILHHGDISAKSTPLPKFVICFIKNEQVLAAGASEAVLILDMKITR